MSDPFQEVLPPETSGTELALVAGITAVAVVSDEKTRKVFFDKVKADFDSFVPDMSTDAGRKAFASKAHEASKAKAEVERTVKAMTEDWRTKTSLANAARKDIIEELETLRVNFRKPLTEWEETQEANKKTVQAFLLEMGEAMRINMDETSDTIADKSEALAGRVLDPDVFGDSLVAAQHEKARVLTNYNAVYDRLVREEADRAELAKMRADRERQEAEEAERQRIENERVQAAQAAQEREQALEQERQAEIARVAQIAEDARLAAIAEQQRIAQAALDEQKRAADAEIAAAQEQSRIDREAREKIEADQRAEQIRLDEIKRQEEIDAGNKRRADEARQQDIEHRGAIMKAAKEAIMLAADIDEPTAKKIVMAIVSNIIPATKISF